jgi:hypothetical protein
VSHVLPPPSFAALAPAAAPAPPVPAPPAAVAAPEDEPSADEVKAFERPVRK